MPNRFQAYRVLSSLRSCATARPPSSRAPAGTDVRPLVALAPGAAYGGAKRWPAASFADLARTLADDGIQAVMVGSRADLPVAREIEAALGGDVILNLMGYRPSDAGGNAWLPAGRLSRTTRAPCTWPPRSVFE